MSRTRLSVLVVLALVAVAIAVGVGLAGGGDDETDDAGPTPSAPVSTTSAADLSLADVDTTTVAVARESFCDAVEAEAVELALGAEPTGQAAYDDGQSAQVTGQVRDIAHEFGCAWSTDTTVARAWVFAPPVTPPAARALVRAAREADGCREVDGAPAFGARSAGLVCDTGRGKQGSFRGLFGDAWLTCTVTGKFDRAEAAARADRWCAAVLAAATA